jgi:hypothetical protein
MNELSEVFIVVRKRPTKNGEFFTMDYILKVFDNEQDARNYAQVVQTSVPHKKYVVMKKEITRKELA